MKKIKFFFKVLKNSLTKFSYYKEIQKANLKFSFKYLFFLFYLTTLIGSIIFAASISVIIIPKIPAFVSSFEAKARSFYPEGLLINIKNGKLSTNAKEPYVISSLDSLGINKGYDHFLTIDTNATSSDFQNESTVVLVTKDSVITPDSNGGLKVYPIDGSMNAAINKNVYDSAIAQISPYLKYIEPAVIILVLVSLIIWPFIGAGLSLLWQLIYLAFFSGIFLLIVKVMKKTFTYKKIYQLAMHASTLPILLGFIASTLGIQLPFLLGTAILLVFMILVLNNLS